MLEATTLCVSGQRINLSLLVDEPRPAYLWREPAEHAIQQIDRNTYDDELRHFFMQGTTHWDGFLHVRAREDGFYGGRQGNPADREIDLGVDNWSSGIVGRGVLIDLPRYYSSLGRELELRAASEVTAEDLLEAAELQGVELSEGSVLCVRTGWMEEFNAMHAVARGHLLNAGCLPGLRADEEMARTLWNLGISAVATDTPAVEVLPGDPQTGSLHRRALVALGIPLGEFFDFAELKQHCETDNRWDFLFVSVPLRLRGGIGSPANALAIR